VSISIYLFQVTFFAINNLRAIGRKGCPDCFLTIRTLAVPEFTRITSVKPINVPLVPISPRKWKALILVEIKLLGSNAKEFRRYLTMNYRQLTQAVS